MSNAPSLSRLYSTHAESSRNNSGETLTGPLGGAPVDLAPLAVGLVVGKQVVQVAAPRPGRHRPPLPWLPGHTRKARRSTWTPWRRRFSRAAATPRSPGARPAAAPVHSRERPTQTKLHSLFDLGAIFATRPFRPLQEEVDPAVRIRVPVALEVQLRDMPEAQPDRQFAAADSGGRAPERRWPDSARAPPHSRRP